MIGSIRRSIFGMLLLLSTGLIFSPHALATTVEISRGIAWLNSQIQGDGSLAGEAVSLATPLQVRAEALVTLAGASIPSTSLGNLLGTDSENTTEYMARRILALRAAGRATGGIVPALTANQNADGGFGGAPGFASNALDTAWALLALDGASGSAVSMIAPALDYLQTVQAGTGAFAAGDPEDVYVSAVALAALEAHASQYPLNIPIGKTVSYLESRKDSNGVWAGSPWLTSVVYLALHDFVTVEPDAGAVRNFLIGTQAADGSWEGGDPFATALALRALAATWIAPTYPTLAHLQGQVVDAQTRLPLDGVAATLSNGQITERITTTAGQFQFLNLSPGNYEFTLALADYGTLSMPLNLVSGQTLNLGVLAMAKPQGATTGTVTGTVRDALNGQPLAGVRIAVDGQALAAFSADDGTYQIAGVLAGSLTLTATKTGYTTVSGSGQLTAGGQLLFSPVLAFGLESDTAIQGRVTHAVTGEPLAGVTLTVTGANALSTTTDALGQYRLGNLASGLVTVTASLGGFSDVTYSGTLQGGSTLFFSPALTPVGTPIDPTKVSGTVRDAATDGPLDGVLVSSGGTAVTTGADGRFLIAKSTSISFAKTGYIGGTLTFESASSALSGAQDLGDIRLLRKDFQGAMLPDLLVQGIETSELIVDPQNLGAEGIVKVSVANFGQTAPTNDAVVTLYEDTDGDGQAGAADRLLGSGTLAAGLAPDGQAATVSIEVGRFARLFRNSRLLAVVDEGQAVAEVRETNNRAFSSCLKPFPFVDDFNDGVLDGWTPIGGSSRNIVNGILVVNGGNSSAWTGDRNWTDYTAEVRLRFPNGGGNDAGLQVRHLGTAIHSAYQLRIKAHHARIIYEGNGINEAPFTVEANRWYTLRMDVAGKSLRAYIDNQLLFARDDINPKNAQGAVGFQEDGVLAEYDDLRVFGPASPGPADISASAPRIVDLGASGAELRARIGNGGGLNVPAGTSIAF
ncbi:MAG TPA: carboxypeptidase regulatory-like domain-containing protein, partial [Methylococcaceae bacterium]|nr:carboxypeptidase regulatory-like domain-containing protein [Methylococcaceae bacterium]